MFPLIGHFENKVKEHLFNALILTIVHFPRSLGMVALHILPLALALFAPQAFIYTLLMGHDRLFFPFPVGREASRAGI